VPRFRYRLLDEDGNDLGPFVAAVGDWEPGHMLWRSSGEPWEVVRVVDAEENAPDELHGYLIIQRS
jgi:hypothetical protein